MKPPIVMIHGAFCGGWCFDGFRDAFEEAGHMVAAPDLPGRSDGVRVAGLSLTDFSAAVVRAIDACPVPPVLLGHSMGGLVVQLAAAKRPVAGLILLSPSPAWGQPLGSVFDMGAGFALAALKGPYWAQAVDPDWNVVRAVTLDKLDEPDARAIYRRMQPDSGRALFEVLNWWLDPTLAGSVTAGSITAPSLVVTGAGDQVNSPATVAPTAARLGVAPRVVPGVSHWMMGGPGSAAVSGLCLEWLAGLGG